jgi:hypothetical protein
MFPANAKVNFKISPHLLNTIELILPANIRVTFFYFNIFIMLVFIYKCLLLTVPFFIQPLAFSNLHPFFVSVTEIEHNATAKTLEISCKIFTDDLEQTLRMHHPGKIDVLDPDKKNEMGKVIAAYIQAHLQVKINGSKLRFNFLGYERQQEAIVSFFEVDNIAQVKNIAVFNNLLYETKPQQMGIIHVTVNSNRKSTKLVNPESDAVFDF